MSKETSIQWCDSTCNFFSGCTMVSPGCANCYAKARDARMMQEKVSHWGKGAPRLKHVGAVKQALAMNLKPWICDECGTATAHGVDEAPHKCIFGPAVHQSFHRRRIFSLSLGDWLDGEVKIEWFVEMMFTVFRCDQVTWILCTKRPENCISHLEKALKYACLHASQFMEKDGFMDWIDDWIQGKPPQNIILLASVENQAMADLRIPQLLNIPAACHGLSLEPLLGPVDLSDHIFTSSKIRWGIIGGESGPFARRCHLDWVRKCKRDLQDADCAVFVKQLGAAPQYREWETKMDRPIELRDKKGGDINEWPTDLRVHQWPKLSPQQTINQQTHHL